MSEKTIEGNIKIILLSLLVMLLVMIHPGEARAFDDSEYVKVGLKHGVTAVEHCKIVSSVGFTLGAVSENNAFSEALPLPGYKELIASVNEGCVELRDDKNVLISADIGINGCLMPYGGEQELLSLDGQIYRGGFILKADGNNKLTVINYLPIEEYLYGVIHREMSMGSPIEALKAQAVTARTFTVLNKDRHRSEGFDVCASTHCQVYGGYKDEYESTNRAVDQTRGILIYYKNEPAETYYYKNSGGHTQNSEDEWSNYAPHLRGIPDPYSPYYPWQATMSFDTLRQKLIQSQMDPGRILSVRVDGYDASGAISTLIIQGEDTDISLSKSKIRAVLGSSLVRSRHFSLGDTYEEVADIEKPFELIIISANGKKNASTKDQVYLLSDKGGMKKSELFPLSLTKGTGTVKVESYEMTRNTGDSESKNIADDGVLKMSGAGYGHGVGMAQDGAVEMAKKGMNYLEILNFYYTGIEVY